MSYILKSTNGTIITTVNDGSIDQTTDLVFVGRNYAGYGQYIDENLLKLLENFSNTSPPSKAISGQLWYDALNKKLKLFSGSRFKSVSFSEVSKAAPTDLTSGDFWYNTSENALYVKNSTSGFTLIGPAANSGLNLLPTTSLTTVKDSFNNSYYVVKHMVNGNVVALSSNDRFTLASTEPLYGPTSFTAIKRGITIRGADASTGVSSNNAFYFWGTAADALRFQGHVPGDFILKNEFGTSISVTSLSTGGVFIPGTVTGQWTLTAGSTLQATYADIAERYEADAIYEPGTVLVIGGDKEVTMSTKFADRSIAGVVSTKPAFKLNAGEADPLRPYIALKGRVPCKVVGPIKKGDLLVTSLKAGYATVGTSLNISDAVIGIALQDYAGFDGIIEIKV
jgi:hypothetical protein